MDIWKDSWIPNSPSHKIMTSRGHSDLSKVNDLIYPISGEWDEELIRDNFWPIDASNTLVQNRPLDLSKG